MIAGLFLYAARELAALYRASAARPTPTGSTGTTHEMLDTIETQAWDGEWYTRAFDAAGQPVGSKTCDEGKIFIESQAWCVLGGAGRDNGRARQALESVHEHLYRRARLRAAMAALHATTTSSSARSRATRRATRRTPASSATTTPGSTLAWSLLGEGDQALDYYLASARRRRRSGSTTYRTEPYVYAQMIAGPDAATPGEAKNSWLTGTAAWSFVASQGILGVKPDYDGLRIDPCIPPRVGLVPRHAALPRRRLRDHGSQPAPRELRRAVVDGRRRPACRRSRPGRTGREHGAGGGRARRQPAR